MDIAKLSEWINSVIHHSTFIVFCTSVIFFIHVLIKNKNYFLKLLSIKDYEVKQLKEEVITLRAYTKELENKIRSMEILVNTLIDRTTEINTHQLEPFKTEIKTLKHPSRPILLVYGTDEFGEEDRNALRKAGVSFFRLKNASLEDLRMELHRRRSDGNLYDIVHISSHGGGDSLLLDTDLVDRFEMAKVLEGVRGVFLATCSNQNISDKLLGIVKYVVMVYEEIQTNYLSNFVYEFYKRYKVDWDIEAAFNGAIAVMPEISEFVDLRIGGTNGV